MSNVSTLTNLKAASAYERAAVIDFLRDIERWAAAKETGNGLDLTVAASLADTVTQVTDSAARIYGVIIASPAGATLGVFVQVFNTDDSDVTLGTTAPRLALFCPAAETVCYAIHSGGSANLFGTGMSIAATTTHDGLTAPASADRPTVKVLSAD